MGITERELDFTRGNRTSMKNFESYLENRKVNAEEEFNRLLSSIAADAIKSGSYGGSRMSVYFQKSISEQVEKFGSELIEFMMKSDPVHSPIKVKNFDAASQAVKELEDTLILNYEKRSANAKHFGNNFVKIKPDDLALEKDKILFEIMLAKATFRSKRSILKWALGDTSKRLYTTVTVIAGMFILEVSKAIYRMIS